MNDVQDHKNALFFHSTVLDATSKPAAGLFEGTVADFGGFDECLNVEFPKRNGDVEFRGQYCAVEARPIMPPTPNNFSMAKNSHADPLDTIQKEIYIAGAAFTYMKFRFGVCVPSLCSLQDMQAIVKRISDTVEMDIQIPQCYIKEERVVFKPIHIAVISVLSLLLLLCILGTIVDYQSGNIPYEKLSNGRKFMVCFSIIGNFRRLMCASKGSEELKALHGLRALSMGWIILGHTYVWINYQLLRSPNISIVWFNRLDFEVILNGWLSVEPFFFLRLTPPLLLTIGLLFFLPLISSGPFWYERVDPEIKACTDYWWLSILYISNWADMKNICVHPTWYLSADFQLHVITIVILYILYKYPKLGLSLICSVVLVCSVVVGVLTFQWDLPPTIQVSSGNSGKIQATIDVVHMKTFTHAGPYYVGIVLGFLMIKYKDVKISKVINICGWCASTVLCLTAVYGAHRWNIGEPHGPLLTSIFAALHRTTFAIGVGWVTFACVTGHGGVVNKILSWSLLAPISRLTFMIYLLHSLVIWVRMGSLRERLYFSHYNMLYEYVGNIVTTVILTVPFYLLLEAPLSNIERLIFSKVRPSKDESPTKQNGHLPDNIAQSANGFGMDKEGLEPATPVKLTGVKSLDLVQNGLH
ncbi:nose resistant to fluoxetine protein 6 [Trichonephila inaurata madagascariensis]|uniref:Nose resistant to fluoxetine protein 6 n=1 Tax=Trichonephila inaurata madagascariensis TaxID=2747483 RepID=A0A8X7C8C7_9ARAC|nr:nose resistant to fluoxetine protein 6 [Trichonephila inaurata madagascariensis]